MLDKTYAQNFTDFKVRLNYNIANDSRTVMDLLNKYSSIDKENDEERDID